jgi:hypothetical protein
MGITDSTQSASPTKPIEPPVQHSNPESLPVIQLATHAQPEPYPAGFAFAGIVWQKGYSDTRLDISVKKSPIHDLDFVVSLDTTIMGIGQITQFPGVTAFPPEGNVSAVTLMGTDEKGNKVAVPISPTEGNTNGAPSYRVHCKEIFADMVLRLAIASQAINPPNPNGSLPQNLFAPHRDPRTIELKGTYKSGTVSYPINFSQTLSPRVALPIKKTKAEGHVGAGGPTITQQGKNNIAQFGNNNQAQIVSEPLDRTLSDSQKVAIGEAAKDIPPDVTIVIGHPTDREASGYAQKIYGAIDGFHSARVATEISYGNQPTPEGLYVFAHTDDEKVLLSATHFYDVIKRSGIQCEAYQVDWVPSGTMTIRVGTKPPEQQ